MTIPCSADGNSGDSVPTRASSAPEATKAPDQTRSTFGEWVPAYDVKLGDREIIVYADLPGVDEDELEIEVLPEEVHIRGERPFDEDREDAEEFVHVSRPYGVFHVELKLPEKVDPNHATAKYRRGVLRVRLPLARTPFRGRRLVP